MYLKAYDLQTDFGYGSLEFAVAKDCRKHQKGRELANY